jgi:hypothetical protein
MTQMKSRRGFAYRFCILYSVCTGTANHTLKNVCEYLLRPFYRLVKKQTASHTLIGSVYTMHVLHGVCYAFIFSVPHLDLKFPNCEEWLVKIILTTTLSHEVCIRMEL